MGKNAANFIYLGNTGLCFSLCLNVTKCPNLCDEPYSLMEMSTVY